ncbi:hypothetical protein GCM10022229_01450 [Luteimonas lutimaris]|uniref:Uncharacterized protein n=1 Tax=Luteimonas lutimaris TaxID=698645 RepID=A0ABP7M5W8_9GAMM
MRPALARPRRQAKHDMSDRGARWNKAGQRPRACALLRIAQFRRHPPAGVKHAGQQSRVDVHVAPYPARLRWS